MSGAKIEHRKIPYPHAGGCDGCYEARDCNACGASFDRDNNRCTNGRCGKCHNAFCTPGGSTDRGHGYGTVAS